MDEVLPLEGGGYIGWALPPNDGSWASLILRNENLEATVKPPTPSPKEFLMARRPERFSDSSIKDVTEMDRGVLEYHLETLTSRSQETEFQNFARELIKLEICPNILPQTGPTGGGDSKVDAETYPVAESLALAWYVGVDRASASERWGFAFSAKAEWQSKLRSDIAKLKATSRGYKKAFFVTNQFVRDKQRAELEDELSKAHKLDVRILDRTWILDTIFDHGRQELAIRELGVSASIRKQIRQGPRDLQREAKLKDLEARIEESVSREEISFVTVDDCIDAAIVSRELERPQTETLGRFDRANNIAAKYGTQHQRIRCAYDMAWTWFFWFEDVTKFAELYGVVEERAKDSHNIYDLELLTNLWMLLHGHAQDVLDVEQHTKVLSERLTPIAANDEAPTAALQARAFLEKIKITRAAAAHEPVDSHLREFSQIVKESESLVGFPFLALADTLIALGELVGDAPEYDSLHDQLVDVVSRRKGEVEGAQLLLQRAEQQLDADRPNDAISSIGKALHRVAKEESRSTFCRALYACTCAYETIGLLWAARGTLLMAASMSMSDFWKYENVTPFQAICFRRLKWIELQLGRIPHVLSWHEVDSVIRRILVAQGYDEAKLREDNTEFDAILGILLLKTDFWELKDLVRLPDELSSMGLDAASVALLYALGQKSEFNPDGSPESEDQNDLSLFQKWRDQPASDDLPATPNLCNQATIKFSSSVLGCAIDVTMPNEPPFVELGESFLAAIESMLATGLARNIMAHEPKLTVTIKSSDFCKEPFEFSVEDESGYPRLTVTCRGFDPDNVGLEQQRALKERLAEMVAYTVGHIVIPDMERIEQLFRDDAAMSRAIDFSGSFQVLGNVLGKDRKRYASSWVSERSQEYKLNRESAWDADCPRAKQPSESFKLAPPGATRPEEAEFSQQFQTSRHSHLQTLSLIRESLWSKADWKGVGVVAFADSPPILALIFGQRDPARRIFSLWEEELGKVDDSESLRISIIRHINKHHPHHYRVVIGLNLERAGQTKRAPIFTISRVHTMTPKSSQNLDSFLHAYRDVGAYFVAPAVVDGSAQFPESIGDFSILKRGLTVRNAWEIGRNDFDQVGILPDDQPAIPEGVIDAPIKELLDWKQTRTTDVKSSRTSIGSSLSSSKSHEEKRKAKKQKRQQVRKSRPKK